MKKPSFKLFLIPIQLLLISFCSSLFAQYTSYTAQYQPRQHLHELALNHLKQKTAQKLKNKKIIINPISKKLRLAICKQPIQVEDKSPLKLYGRMTIKLQCPLPSWKIFVTAKVEGELPVIIAKHGITKQTLIAKNDITVNYVPYKKLKRGAMTSLESVIGMRSKKSIYPNAIITINMLQPPYLVFKNQPITIVSYIGNLKVTTKGTALASGTKQQQISFRNNKSKKTLKGIVIAPNTVWVP